MSASGGGSDNMEAAAKEQAQRDELVQEQGKLAAARAEVEDTNKTRVTLSGEYADASGVLRRAMKELDFTRKQIYDEQHAEELVHVKKRNLERAVKKLEDISEERRVWTEAWERRLEDLRQTATLAGEAALEVAKENLDFAKAGICGDHNAQEPDNVRDMLSPVVQDSVLCEMDRIQEIAKKAGNASCTLEEAVHSLAEANEDREIQRQQGEKHRELLDTERKKLKKVEKEWRKTMEDFEFLEGKEAQAKESLNAAKSVAAAKQNELKEAIKAHNNAKSLVAEIRETEANIARQLRDCAELPMHAASRERLVAEFADWERTQEEEDSARDEEQRLEEELDHDDEQPQMCHNLEAVQDAWNDETTHEFGGDAGYPDNNAEPAATRQDEVESEPSRNNGKVSSNQDKDRPRRYGWVDFLEQGREEASSEDDRPRRRYHPDEQQEEEEEEDGDDDDDDEHRISLSHQSSHIANVQRRSSKGKGSLGKSRMAASSQATRVFGGAQQRQARTVDHQTVATGNSKGKGKARGGANILRQDHAASSTYEWTTAKGVPRTGLFGGVWIPRKNVFSRTTESNDRLGFKRKTPTPSQVAGEEGTGRRHHENRQQEGGRAADQNIPKKRVRSAGQKISPGWIIERGERAPPRFSAKLRRRSSSSPSVSRAPEAVAETSTNAQTGASSESNAVATTTTEAAMSTGKAKESPNTDSTSETPAALARVELSCKIEPAMSEGSSASS